MAEAEGASILETPPVFLAVVFVFFLVVTLGFEKILDWIKERLKRQGKNGLVAAMEAMSTELMLMGVATLILLVFQRDIDRVCVHGGRYVDINWLDHVRGCACCLTRTNDVSPCYFRHKGCESLEELEQCCQDIRPGNTRVCNDIDPNFSRRLLETALDSGDTPGRKSSTSPQGPNRALLAETGDANKIRCIGRVEVGWGSCPADSRPAVGALAMHQVHLMIFLMAICHIGFSIVLILLSSWRTSTWTHWAEEGDRYHEMVRVHLTKSKDSSLALALAEVGAHEKDNTAGRGQEQQGGPVQDFCLDVPRDKPWKGRPVQISAWKIPLEWFWCVVRQFQPNQVKREEFCLMRASFYYHHRISPAEAGTFTFMDYVVKSLEDDFARVVGLGLPMWIFLVIFILLSAKIGWCIWIFIALAGGVLLVVNTKLVIITRYVTRGGSIHTLEPGIFWLNRPWMLLPVIKFLLFLCSFVFSNALFFGIIFGRKSCFFSRTGFQGTQPLPWWANMIVTAIYFLVLSLNTMPLYSLAVQMGGDYKGHLIPKKLAAHMTEASQKRERGRTQRKGLSRVLSKAVPRARDSRLPEHHKSNAQVEEGVPAGSHHGSQHS